MLNLQAWIPERFLFHKENQFGGQGGGEAHGRTRTGTDGHDGTTDTNITPHPPTKTK